MINSGDPYKSTVSGVALRSAHERQSPHTTVGRPKHPTLAHARQSVQSQTVSSSEKRAAYQKNYSTPAEGSKAETCYLGPVKSSHAES